MAALFHFALQRKQVGKLKKHRGKATPEGVMQAIASAIRVSGIGDGGERLRPPLNHRFQGQTA